MVWGKMSNGVGKICKVMWGKFVKWCGGKWCGGGVFENSNGVGEQKKRCGIFKWCGEKIKDGVGKI